jgi:hypothetical protein
MQQAVTQTPVRSRIVNVNNKGGNKDLCGIWPFVRRKMPNKEQVLKRLASDHAKSQRKKTKIWV